MTKEARNPKDESRRELPSGFGHSSCSRIWSFVIRHFSGHFREWSVALALGALLLALALFAPAFYQPQPLRSLLAREAPALVVACGMALVILGRQIDISVGSQFAVGSDAEAARLAGIRPRLVTFFTFVLLGALTGLAAMMNVVQSPQVDPKSGTGLELKVIAAVVVGGVAISGGRGNLWGVFAGLLLLACISPALTHLHVEPYWERAIQGAIILLALVADGV